MKDQQLNRVKTNRTLHNKTLRFKSRESRGFTLVELIAVLGILVIITLIAVPTINSLVDDAAEDTQAVSYEMIEKAASMVHSANGSGNQYETMPGGYSVKSLVDNGFLKYDESLGVDMNEGMVYNVPGEGMTYANRNYVKDSGKHSTTRNSTGGGREHMYYTRIDDALAEIGDGETITISFDVKADVGDYVLAYDSNRRTDWYFAPSKSFSNFGTDWTRLSFTSKVVRDPSAAKSSETFIEFYGLYDTGNHLEVKNVKIEKGLAATPWIPAIED